MGGIVFEARDRSLGSPTNTNGSGLISHEPRVQLSLAADAYNIMTMNLLIRFCAPLDSSGRICIL